MRDFPFLLTENNRTKFLRNKKNLVIEITLEYPGLFSPELSYKITDEYLNLQLFLRQNLYTAYATYLDCLPMKN